MIRARGNELRDRLAQFVLKPAVSFRAGKPQIILKLLLKF